jgi:hypothetical protein
VSENTVTSKDGTVIHVCTFRNTDPDGRVNTCHAPKACAVCNQCSRIDSTGRELGHCTGHLGLIDHIEGIPGTDTAKVRTELDKARQNLPKRAPQRRGRDKRRKEQRNARPRQ